MFACFVAVASACCDSYRGGGRFFWSLVANLWSLYGVSSYATKSSHHWCAHGPGPKPPRRGHGAVGAARRGTAIRDQEAGPHRRGYRQPRSEAAGRNASRRKTRKVPAGNCRDLPGHCQKRGQIANRRILAVGAGWRPLDRGRGTRRGGRPFSQRKKADWLSVAGCAWRYEHAGEFALGKRAWYAAGRDYGLRRR